ncbi:MAG TPA: P-II family nitrogen regulator [Candidatus Fusicatenibacter merdavium]|uniref:P-II family nitrogen regulator n=1 Tax=Candidatus Fusicatenibacter merdavium TaxID=2838600 RepID=A0A9D1XCU7_9FIRM|nr:P-II family nitrogen regulator [Candidatus Fusicatenibacter merdavium]
MKKLTVIVKPGDREDVIRIMESCAVYGVMETDITGYGNQKGYRVMYRGVMSGPNVLMKCKFETIGDDKTIELLREFLEKQLCTGSIGDGKIFVEKVADVIRIRTGQRGEEAM